MKRFSDKKNGMLNMFTHALQLGIRVKKNCQLVDKIYLNSEHTRFFRQEHIINLMSILSPNILTNHFCL